MGIGRQAPVTIRRAPSIATLAGLLVIGQPALYEHVGPRPAHFMASLRTPQLNARDQALQQRGYYEELFVASQVSSELWSLNAQQPASWLTLQATPVYRHRGDFGLGDLQPSMQIELRGHTFTTNRWGMRDQEYDLVAADDVQRIAFLGPSFVMGLGTGDDETIDVQLEAYLNAGNSPAGTRYEVLNFAVANHSLLQQLTMLHERALQFRPDVVIVTMTERRKLVNAVVRHLTRVKTAGFPVPFSQLDSLLAAMNVGDVRQPSAVRTARRLLGLAARRVGFDRTVAEGVIERRLRAGADQLVEWSLVQIAEFCYSIGAVPVLLGLDIVGSRYDGSVPAADAARQAGFVVIDLFDVYDSYDPSVLRVAEWDSHPNGFANRLIAERLYTELRYHARTLKLNLQTVEQPSQ